MIEALITGVVAIAVCMINNYFQNKQAINKHEEVMEQTRTSNRETIDMIDYKLTQLSKRVDKHNNVIDRTYRLEQVSAVQDEQIKVANHRLNDLESEVNK
ncbi:hypothetical protein [Muricomes intestini]|uniref:hypothetical protein n=1 Tax=Muricomes intestini TaxID=1796634 RepID=UPI002FE16A1B